MNLCSASGLLKGSGSAIEVCTIKLIGQVKMSAIFNVFFSLTKILLGGIGKGEYAIYPVSIDLFFLMQMEIINYII